MSESAYRFFRGTRQLFWQDTYNDWRYALFGGYRLDDFDDAVVPDTRPLSWLATLRSVWRRISRRFLSLSDLG